MISYLGSLVQFSPAAGRAGLCRQMSLCVGSLRRVLAGQPEAWRALSTCALRPLPPRPQRAPPVGSQEVFTQDPGPVCRVGGGGFSGAEFSPFPSPLPPTSSWDGAALLWSFSVPLFCVWPVLTLSNAAGSSPFRPLLLVAGAGVWGTFLLGVAFRHVICGPYLISPPS